MRNPYRRHLATLAIVALLLAVPVAAGCGGRSETTSTTSPAARRQSRSPRSPSSRPRRRTTTAGTSRASRARQGGGGVRRRQAHRPGRRGLRRHHADHEPAGRPEARSSSSRGPAATTRSAPQMAQQLKIPVTSQRPGTESANVPGLGQRDRDQQPERRRTSPVSSLRSMTKTSTVAIVVSADDLNWSKMSGGFIAGARRSRRASRSSSCRSARPPMPMRRAASASPRAPSPAGADIVFGMGDGSSFGMMQAVETATPPSGADKVWFIDVIGDKTLARQEGHLPVVGPVGLHADLRRRPCTTIQDGTFGQKSYLPEPRQRHGPAADRVHPRGRLDQDRDRQAGHHRRQHPRPGDHEQLKKSKR